jgi:hypothetical protein
MKVVSDNKDFEERRCRQRVESALRELTGNLLRVARGAGRHEAIYNQALQFVIACKEYHEQVGYYPDNELPAILNTAPDFDAPELKHAEHKIVRGALQMTASRLLGQWTQERNGENEFRAGIIALDQGRAAHREQLARAQQTAAADQAARRRAEPMFLIDPLHWPVLLDEGLWPELGQAPRSAEELTAAEERLRELGFVLEADGNVMAWKYRQEPYTVLADPRVRGRLTFCIYHEARLAAASRRRRQSPAAAIREAPFIAQGYYLLDSWRHDIVGKFRTRVQQAIAKLDEAPGRRND